MAELIIVLGPTAVGKTEFSLNLAEELGSPIVNCDSRQVFREMRIGTARPTEAEMARVKHYLVASRSVTENYTAGMFELDALAILEALFKTHDKIVMTGGSGLYVDALVNGLDAFPPADPALRAMLMRRVEREGVESLRFELRKLDPESAQTLDPANRQRIVRALEVCIATGRPFSSFKTNTAKKRPFAIKKIGLTRERSELYDRINRRVDAMIDDGLEDEVRSLLPYRNLPALHTVGYREMFSFIDGEISLDEAIEKIKLNTRHYAKKQLTYWGRDTSIAWQTL